MRKAVLLLFLVAVLAANAAYFLLRSDDGLDPEAGEAAPASVATAPPMVEPPPLEALGHGARPPTPEELEDEVRFDASRVTEADTRMHSSEVKERLAGAEQLSAYPTPDAEQILANALALDFDPEVRKTAAESLSAFEKLSGKTVSTLLSALNDDSEGVQISAWNTLQGLAQQWPNSSPQMKKLLADLAAQAASRRTKPSVGNSITAFLKDQAIPAAPISQSGR